MRRGLWIIPGVICLAAAIFFGARAIESVYAPGNLKTEALGPTPTMAVILREQPEEVPYAATVEIGQTRTVPAGQNEPEAPYVSPVDFAALREINPDIWAWIEIADTNINYPFVQEPENDAFYMNHDSDRNWSGNGALFSEASCNTPDLRSDPVTLVYGHHMMSGAMFGFLERYFSDTAFFESHPEFTVYTPDAELRYGVFAAVPYPSEHILKNHDFSDDEEFESFFAEIFRIRALNARFNEDYAPEAGDRVLILSTCLASNNRNRYVVMAKLLP